MKHSHLAALALLGGALIAQAQFNYNNAWNSGSTGTYGPLNILTNTTLDMPPDGIFNCTTINIAAGATLTFNKNAANTPVYLLATADVTIAGTIDVSGSNPASGGYIGGAGGPGGFAGGFGAYNSLPAGDGYGPGRGHAGDYYSDGGGGGYGSVNGGSCNGHPSYGSTYGSPLLVPLVGGSGGGGGLSAPGAGGGGAVLVASSTTISVSGSVSAAGGGNGTSPYVSGCGSGGAIRLVAPVVSGSGTLYAAGGQNSCNAGGGGRIRVDTLNRRNIAFNNYGSYYIGAYMVALPLTPSSLNLINVGGTNIPPGSSSVAIQFPNNSTNNINVTLQASNFNAVVNTAVAVIPQNGPSATYTCVIDNQASNPATNSVNITIPVNNIVTISAWTTP